MSLVDASVAASEAYAQTADFASPFVNNAALVVGSGSRLDYSESGISDSGASGSTNAEATATAARGSIASGSPGALTSSTSSFLWLLVAAGVIAAYLLSKK